LNKPIPYKLAVIIVNYNVEYFLEQCLSSVEKALQQVTHEVYVVDNNSVDGSVAMVRDKFPWVKVIANTENVGFSKANNQAIQESNAEYVLLLNPDTVVEEDTFIKSVSFMDENPEAGGLGVRMVDGKGQFLPESKRGLPTPQVAFFKIFGLSKLFSKSKRFNRYHLGHLNEFETHEIDVLSGAFMLMRKSVLEKIGLLDETFFMYGEDIDLSYRIQVGGYKNFYFPETRIIHYKGESTKKGSINYVFVFYKAMVIFAKKHFSQNHAKTFSFLIHLAIYLRASLAITQRIVKTYTLPLFDFTVLLTGLYAITNWWTINHIEFNTYALSWGIPSYCIGWFFANYLGGTYDLPNKLQSTIKATGVGTLVILLFYGLLPKDFQFSRLFILVGTCWVSLYYVISRIYLHLVFKGKFNLFSVANRRFLIVGETEECIRVSNFLKQAYPNIELIEFISAEEKYSNQFRGGIHQLEEIARLDRINEIVFCAKDLTAQAIISNMIQIDSSDIDFKIAQPDSTSLIGSNSIHTAGDLYVLDINAITKQKNIRKKRIFDLALSMVGLILSPLLLFGFKHRTRFIKNLLLIIIGNKSFVGYERQKRQSSKGLPRLKPGILTPADGLYPGQELAAEKLNLIYARDYAITKDISILTNGWKKLDS